MAETLSKLSVVAYVVAGVCLLLAIFLWFLFKIPTVIGDLSGKTARKSIAKMRAANEKSGNKAYRVSDVNQNRGKLTETMKNPRAFAQAAPSVDPMSQTGVLMENRPEAVDTEETGMLMNEAGTSPLAPPPIQQPVRTGGKQLRMIEEIICIHTNEVIG